MGAEIVGYWTMNCVKQNTWKEKKSSILFTRLSTICIYSRACRKSFYSSAKNGTEIEKKQDNLRFHRFYDYSKYNWVC